MVGPPDRFAQAVPPYPATVSTAACVISLVLIGRYLRRCKVTSNICTNEALCALAAAYLAALGPPGVQAVDIAKRLIDCGLHPPIMYFPLTVKEALMIEPTETESKATLDCFIEAMIRIANEAYTDPDSLRSAPHTTRLVAWTRSRQPGSHG